MGTRTVELQVHDINWDRSGQKISKHWSTNDPISHGINIISIINLTCINQIESIVDPTYPFSDTHIIKATYYLPVFRSHYSPGP